MYAGFKFCSWENVRETCGVIAIIIMWLSLVMACNNGDAAFSFYGAKTKNKLINIKSVKFCDLNTF